MMAAAVVTAATCAQEEKIQKHITPTNTENSSVNQKKKLCEMATQTITISSIFTNLDSSTYQQIPYADQYVPNNNHNDKDQQLPQETTNTTTSVTTSSTMANDDAQVVANNNKINQQQHCANLGNCTSVTFGVATLNGLVSPTTTPFTTNNANHVTPPTNTVAPNKWTPPPSAPTTLHNNEQSATTTVPTASRANTVLTTSL